ncbi:MAG: tetratricopeptide repeat protein, partial [Gemmatimonadetes bacterium]|nr:tetratricopeptide repeat protein [Gemmatimonadota bacterium]
PLVTCLLFFVSAEYRLPVALFTIPFAAFALVAAGTLIRQAIARKPAPGKPAPGSRAPATSRVPAGSRAPSATRARVALAFLALIVFAWFTNRTDRLLEAQTWKRVDYLNFGTLYLNRGDLDEAEAMFHQSLAIDPRFAPAYESLSEVARRRGNDQAAARWITKAREFGAAGQYDRGRAQYDDITEALIAVAAIYNEGRFEEALVGFQKLRTRAMATERADLLSTIGNNVGLCLYKMGRYANAEDEFRMIMDRDPYYKKAHYNIGRVFEATGRAGEAIAAYESALALDPGYAMAEEALRRLRADGAGEP